MAKDQPAPYTGNGIMTLTCPVRPCKGEKCRNYEVCDARKDGRDILKVEQAQVC